MQDDPVSMIRRTPAAASGQTIAPGLRAERDPVGDRAYVTLVTNPDYLPGAKALIRSLRLTGSRAEIAVLHRGLGQAHLGHLRGPGVRLIAADLLPTSPGFDLAHARDALHARAAFTRGTKPDFHTPLDNFVKLRLWQLDYARTVFIDADALVLRNVDKLFDFPEFCAAPNVYDGLDGFHRMNSGVFTARPSATTYAAMLARLDRPGVFWARTDQTFLQDFFPGWHGLPIQFNMLQYVWMNLPALWDWDSLHILHYQYEKPWSDHAKVPALRPLVDLWRRIAAGGPIPDLAAQARPAA